MVDLTDTHCHIHEAVRGYQFSSETQKRYEKAGSPSADEFVKNARDAGVNRLICVGTTLEDSALAIEFAGQHDQIWASIGIHPHEAQRAVDDPTILDRFAKLAAKPKVVAVGECGLDFFYSHSPREAQERVLRFQIELALKHNLPMIFHVRDAFNEFWPIFDSYPKIRGVIHSFSSSTKDVEAILGRGLFVGLNGIMTFTKDIDQLAAAKRVPLDRLLLETDAPFLTPTPYRGTLCEPKHVRVTAEFLAELRGETLDLLSTRTSANAQKLFGLL